MALVNKYICYLSFIFCCFSHNYKVWIHSGFFLISLSLFSCKHIHKLSQVGSSGNRLHVGGLWRKGVLSWTRCVRGEGSRIRRGGSWSLQQLQQRSQLIHGNSEALLRSCTPTSTERFDLYEAASLCQDQFPENVALGVRQTRMEISVLKGLELECQTTESTTDPDLYLHRGVCMCMCVHMQLVNLWFVSV